MSEDKQMTDLSPREQAVRAISHTLGQTTQNPELAYWIGYGSQTRALLTEALASLTGEHLETIRGRYEPSPGRRTPYLAWHDPSEGDLPPRNGTYLTREMFGASPFFLSQFKDGKFFDQYGETWEPDTWAEVPED